MKKGPNHTPLIFVGVSIQTVGLQQPTVRQGKTLRCQHVSQVRTWVSPPSTPCGMVKPKASCLPCFCWMWTAAVLDETTLLPALSQHWHLGAGYLFTRMLSMPLEESMICMALAWDRPAHDFPLIDNRTSFSHRPPRHALLLFRI